MSAPIVLNEYTPGGVFKQLADAAGDGVEFWQGQPGGAIEQLRKLADPTLVLSQYYPGGVYKQIYDVVSSGGGGGGDLLDEVEDILLDESSDALLEEDA